MKKTIIIVGIFILLTALIVLAVSLNYRDIIGYINSKGDAKSPSACALSGGELLQECKDDVCSDAVCKCPIETYEDLSSETCKKITKELISKCGSLSTDETFCSNSETYDDFFKEGICECNFSKFGFFGKIQYDNLEECDCSCSVEECGCICI